MALIPRAGTVLVTQHLQSEAEAADLRKRMAKVGLLGPQKVTKEFEPIPSVGFIWALPEGYSHDYIKVGAKVVFKEQNPKGFKWEGEKLLSLDLEQIVAVVLDD